MSTYEELKEKHILMSTYADLIEKDRVLQQKIARLDRIAVPMSYISFVMAVLSMAFTLFYRPHTATVLQPVLSGRLRTNEQPYGTRVILNDTTAVNIQVYDYRVLRTRDSILNSKTKKHE